MLCLSLSFILLLWVRIVHGRPFSLVQHVVIVCVYVSQVVSLVALSIARQVIGGTALAVVHAMVIPLYFVVFAIGLVIFGCRMYSDLQRIAQVMMRREKFVWSNLKFVSLNLQVWTWDSHSHVFRMEHFTFCPLVRPIPITCAMIIVKISNFFWVDTCGSRCGCVFL